MSVSPITATATTTTTNTIATPEFSSTEELLNYMFSLSDEKLILETSRKYRETLIPQIKPSLELFQKIEEKDFPYHIFSEVFSEMYKCFKAIKEGNLEVLDELLDTYATTMENETNILQMYFLKMMHEKTNGAMWKFNDRESYGWKVLENIFRLFAYYTPQDIWDACSQYNDKEPYAIIAYGDMDYEVPSYIASQWHRYVDKISNKNGDWKFTNAVNSTIETYLFHVSRHTLTKKEYTKHIAYVIESVKEGNPFFRLLAKHMIELMANPVMNESELIDAVLQYGTVDMLKYMFITKVPDNAFTLLQMNRNVNAENMKDAISFIYMNSTTPIPDKNSESPWTDEDYEKMVSMATETKNKCTPP